MEKCLICHEEINNNFTITSCKCNVIYHSVCYEKWINKNRSCPTCRYIYKIKTCKNNKKNKFNITFNNYNILRIMNSLGGLTFSD